jgi:hypothetical protein
MAASFFSMAREQSDTRPAASSRIVTAVLFKVLMARG